MVWTVLDESHLEALNEITHAKSDRTVVVLGGALLDDNLRRALELRMKESTLIHKFFNIGGPMANLSPKADLGYLLGMFEKQVYHAIVGIAGIRNSFAHDLTAKFSNDDKRFVEDFSLLKLHKSYTHYFDLTTREPGPVKIETPKSNKDIFIVNLKLCNAYLISDFCQHQPFTNTPTTGDERPSIRYPPKKRLD